MKRTRSTAMTARRALESASGAQFPFLDLIDDLQQHIARAFLDSATRCCLALTCKKFLDSPMFDPRMFGPRFAEEAARASHVDIINMYLSWDGPFIPESFLAAVMESSDAQTLDLMDIYLDMTESWCQQVSDYNRFDVFLLFVKAFAAFILAQTKKAFDPTSIFTSKVWRKLSEWNSEIIESVVCVFLESGCYQFFRALVDYENSKRRAKSSSWLRAIDSLNSIAYVAFTSSSIEELLWYSAYQRRTFTESSPEQAIFNLIVMLGPEGEHRKEKVLFAIDYMKRTSTNLGVVEIFRELSRVGDIECLQLLIAERPTLFPTNESFVEAIEEGLDAGMAYFQTKSLVFYRDYLSLLSKDRVCDMIRRYLIEGDNDLAQSHYTERLPSAVRYVLSDYPDYCKSALINMAKALCSDAIMATIHLEDLPFLDFIMEKLEGDYEHVLDNYIGMCLQGGIPEGSWPAINHLLAKGYKIDPKFIFDNLPGEKRKKSLSKRKKFRQEFAFEESICRREPFKYLQFVESLVGDEFFQYMNPKCVASCLQWAGSAEILAARVKLSDFAAAFKYAFLKSELSWKKEWTNLIEGIKRPSAKAALMEVARELSTLSNS